MLDATEEASDVMGVDTRLVIERDDNNVQQKVQVAGRRFVALVWRKPR